MLVYFKAAQAGKYTNTAVVSATESDPNTANNTASADAFVNSAGQPVKITSDLTAIAVKGVPFSYTVGAQGSTPISYNIAYPGDLASLGLTVNGNTISGTPTQGGVTRDFNLTATNAAGSDAKTLTITFVNPTAQSSQPTPTGSNVVVNLNAGSLSTQITFSSVQSNGTTTLSLLNSDDVFDQLEPLIQTFITGKPKPVVFDVSTTSSVTPPVQVCLPVPNEYKPLLALGQVHLFHGINVNANGQTLTFEDATTKVDANAGTVCATTKSLSPFVLAVASNTVGFQTSTVTANEADGKVTVTVTRTGDMGQAASVNYATANGTASERRDFVAAYGTLNFAAGETSKTITVFLENDTYADPTKSFTVTLSNAVGAGIDINNSTVTVNITNNDANNGKPNPIDDPTFFVTQHYLDFLNRQPDAAGLNFWTNQISSCNGDAACVDLKRTNVSAAYFLSTEFQQTGYLVYKTWKAAYGDINPPTVPVPVRFADFVPDVQAIGHGVIVGQSGYQDQLEANKQQFFNAFVTRPQFTAKYNSLSNSDYLNALNQNVGGAIAASDISTLLAGLNAGTETRATVLRKVAENSAVDRTEFSKAFVLMQYFGYLRRDPDAAPDSDFSGYQFWLNKLNQANGDYIASQMVRSFIVSQEYRQRFGAQ